MEHDLYVERLAAIRHFGATDGFDLFGRGWHEPVSGADALTKHSIAGSYRGPLPSDGKITTLTGYRFTLCFENTIFPGYITEKIFDCLLAGTIPIYLGAPDITDYLPPEAFVDFRDFSDMASLEDYLRVMPAEDAHARIEAGRSFLHSRPATRFTESAQVELLSGLLLDSFAKADSRWNA
ncbi:MAG: glycosyltransferase family 10 [Actinobacteria bacterium]|nr:glycosyltransferase family 10 [Actinomycetota bacterium]